MPNFDSNLPHKKKGKQQKKKKCRLYVFHWLECGCMDVI